ncbi:hypothetical protein A2V68_00035 [candidate division Kazan bacterium RBG_13_50_9]|uniref:Capsule synthesis protein CapA domain-containing protein n=1 Tax=candidate division Kazan bacterium RBG_13_50_9 TaxID=1798535 RepID=A0A1F4NRA4_UNCK3|nr:MAG: hypothetical protein A2V68_00035 [candidate division Kazan bacterium RBG_13_50_9]
MLQKRIFIYLAILLILYGFWVATKSPGDQNKPNNRNQTIKILAVGDINLGRQTGQKILGGDYDYAFEYLNEVISSYDLAFGNLESQLADLDGETQSPTNEYRFAGPPEGADGLKSAGFDIVSLANNHMWDYGQTALFETFANLERAGVEYTGANRSTANLYKPTTIEVNGQKIAFFAVTMLLNGYEKSGAADYVAMADTEKLLPAITAAKAEADWIIVSLHGGIEYRATPIPAKVELAREIVDAGANVVIGHHTHVPQGVEQYHDGLILYSLGNFAFWQPFGYWTEHSFVTEIYLKPNIGVDYNPIAINSGWQPRLANGDDEAKILQYVAQLSANLNR